MTNLDTLSRGDLFDELSDLARRQGVQNEDMWRQLVDETIESHLDIGEVDPDQDLEGLREAMYGRWESYWSQAGEERPSSLNEDPKAPR
jgi:hypothetical protein